MLVVDASVLVAALVDRVRTARGLPRCSIMSSQRLT
jgi:hypothetical protein